MSSNNQLIILKNEQGNFEIHENQCVDNKFRPSRTTFLDIKFTLEDAYKFAQKYMIDNIVEYGVYVSPNCWEKRKEK